MQFQFITVGLAALAAIVSAAPVQSEVSDIAARGKDQINFAYEIQQINQNLMQAGIEIRVKGNFYEYCTGFGTCYESYRDLVFRGCNRNYLGYCSDTVHLDVPWFYQHYPNFLDYGVGRCVAPYWIGCSYDVVPDNWYDVSVYKKDVSSAEVKSPQES